MNREHALNLLHDVHSVLAEGNLTHFLIDGTLLGAYREGDFIAHDYDLDLGVYAEEWSQETIDKVVAEMATKGIKVNHTFGVLERYFEIAFERDDVKIDLFFYRKEGPFRIHHAFLNGGRTLPDDVITYEYPAELIDELGTIEFLGTRFPAPKNPERVIETKYGADWRTPDPHWDWAFSPKNVRR